MGPLKAPKTAPALLPAPKDASGQQLDVSLRGTFPKAIEFGHARPKPGNPVILGN